MAAPSGDGPAPGAAWTAGQVARHLNISESTLRTWHRRYGLDPDGARPGSYRRYQDADIARLRRMAELVDSGMLASEAAKLVQAGESAAVPAERDIADLASAARSLDSDRCRSLFDEVIARRGVTDAWELVGMPALATVDADQRLDPARTDTEHALSWGLLSALNGLHRQPAATGVAHVLLACADGELHTLPLAALAAALAERHVPVRMLGAANPAPSLVRAAREARPAVVVLWSQRPETADLEALRSLSECPLRLIIAGPGWPASPPSGVTLFTTLREAVALLAR